MCNRVRASFEFRETKIRWNLFNDLPEFKPAHNIAPDRDDILAVVRSEPGNEGRLMYWPLIPSFAKTMKLEYSTSNATAERLMQSAVYKWLVNNRRCLIPVSGFYEWQGVKPPKTPFYVYLKSDEPFGLAGLWDAWKKPGGGVLVSFTIITTEPNDLMRTIHRRMPVILHRDDEERWLDCSANPFDKVQSLLKPFPSDLMAAHEVSKRMNNPKYDAPDCSAPVQE
ncbi:MAG TPA: SOS response-associated peptidase [Acidobacteriota bacterium]|nr:SOS response-associated peptidase [Acidobacteriota bacterium]